MRLESDRLKSLLENIKDEDIHFKNHFYERVRDRPISEEMIREYIRRGDKIVNIEEQTANKDSEKKYKIWFKMSNRYSLVIIATISKKSLNIITAWNTDRKWQRSMQK